MRPIHEGWDEWARELARRWEIEKEARRQLMSDISDLFQRDPEHLTREDISAIVAKYREARAQFTLGALQAGNPKKIKAVGPKITNLDDLDLDI